MERYNIFKHIHKGLRALLYDVSLTIQRTSFSHNEQTARAFEKIELSLNLFESHTYIKDVFLLPVIEKVDNAIPRQFEIEHKADLDMSGRLKKLILNYRFTGNNDDQSEASAICNAFMEFMIFNLQHMEKEEKVLNQTLWHHFSDKDIEAIERKIIANIPPGEMAEYSKWMLLGVNNDEAIQLMSKIRRKAPDIVYETVYITAEKELPSERWYTVMEGMYDV